MTATRQQEAQHCPGFRRLIRRFHGLTLGSVMNDAPRRQSDSLLALPARGRGAWLRTGLGVFAVWMAIGWVANAQRSVSVPELAPLERYLGRWTYEGQDKTPVTGGRVTCVATRRWISEGYFVESHRDCTTPRGRVTQVEVFGYDFVKKVYVYWGFSGAGISTYVASQMDGDTVIWTGLDLSAGNRCTEVFSRNGGSSTDKCETSRDGGATWILRAAGRSAKSR